METNTENTTDTPSVDDAIEMTEAVFAAPDSSVAEIIRGVLDAEGIPSLVGEQVMDAFPGAMATGEGYWGEIRVRSEDAGRAREVISAYDRGEGGFTEADLLAQAEASSDPNV